MKFVYATVLVCMEILIVFTISRTLAKTNRNSPLAQKVRDLLACAFWTVLPNIFVTYATRDFFAQLCFSCYGIGIDFMLYFLLYFSVEYAYPGGIAKQNYLVAFYKFFRYDIKSFFTHDRQKTSLFEKLMLGLFAVILADSFSLVRNIWTGGIFTVERFYYSGVLFEPDVYYRIVPNWTYDIHLAVSYLLVILSFVCMIHKIIRATNLYKAKYLSVIFQIAFVVAVNSFYIMFELPVDYSVAFYGMVCVSLYYFAFRFIPLYLQRTTITRVIQNMNNGIIILDSDDQCIYVNDYIRRVYRVKSDQNPNDIIVPVIKRLAGGKPLSELVSKEETIHQTVDNQEIYYRLSFSRIENAAKKFIGSYFVMVDTTEENNREKLEHFRNTHDAMTGLYNKEYFYDMVAKTLEENPDEKYYILCSDIGKFKLINELYGVAVGDKILKLIARALSEKAVIGEVYGRIDNDRFAMLIPKDRLNLQVFIDGAKKIFNDALDLSISPVCYFGVYEIEDTDMRVSFMCDRAFIAIDTIKDQFGKQIVWYDSKLRDNVLREQELVFQLPEAITTGQIKIFLQPQSTVDGKAVGAEALVRWEHPDEGIVSPAEFMPIFEKNGMITKIDRHVWRLAFQKVYEWKLAGHDDFYISVNVSPKDFYLMNIYNEFNDLLKEFAIDPKNIHIEITESVMMMDLERQIKLIEQLRAGGFTIEIGDFGTGYSSLKILRECNIDILKIDMDFLQKTSSPRNAHIIIRQLISMAQNLGIKVLAKGIETKDEMDLLHDDGCDLFQGFYFSKPVDTIAFEKIYL